MRTADSVLPPAGAMPVTRATADHGPELKRGALINTLALLASNFRGVFTFLVARILGPATLGTFLVAYATMDVLSKIGMWGLDNTIIAFIARSEAAGDRARSRSLFRVAVFLAVTQCTILALVAIAIIELIGNRLSLPGEMIPPLALLLCALPGVTLYRISTAVSRGMKVMGHDVYSRGITESVVTTLAFLAAVGLGATSFAPALAVIIGTGASGLVALNLAASLFRQSPPPQAAISSRMEAGRLLRYGTSISAYDLLNSLIVRLDVIMLGFFIGRAPGVTLAAVGIYGTVVEVAGGLRKVNQAFNPIFAPIVASLTTDGEQERARREFSRVAQWMLWVLLPLVAVMFFAGPVILSIYGPAFRAGSGWLVIVALACGTNALVGLAETVIMVQKPQLNLINSSVTLVVAILANLWLISRFGVTGAAFGILLPYVLLGILRHRALRQVFRWKNPWADLLPPFLGAFVAALPAAVCYWLVRGLVGQISSAAVFLLIYFLAWQYQRRQRRTLA
ncbi:MAG TPA: oligosaccharide flippase family protein [Chthoniobacterales bacterium]|jgi:O-antigen/teichoic acid export membrane protein